MTTNRREFLERSTALLAGLGAHTSSVGAQSRGAMPTPRASAFMKSFGLKYPISNAGMGGTASDDLAIAVANAGGLAALGTGIALAAETVRTRVSRVRESTKSLFAINYLLAFEPVTLPVALDAGVPIVQFAWGMPGPSQLSYVRNARAKLALQVSNVEGARQALDMGADYLILQGTEAGGHVQALSSWSVTLPAVLAEAKAIPVLVAGGIGNGADIHRALLAGASGAVLGTRFVATKEALAHGEYKNALAKAKSADTALTICYQDGWPNAPHRVLRNKTVNMWEAAGCPAPGKRPGEGDVLTTNTGNGSMKRRYSVGSPVPNDSGAIEELPHFAGMSVDHIRDVPSAADLVPRLWSECLSVK